MATLTDRSHAHELIERLPESQLLTAVRFLEFMLLDPVARAIALAPPDDEAVTAEDRERFRLGQTYFAEGNHGTSMEDVLAEFGLTMGDFPIQR